MTTSHLITWSLSLAAGGVLATSALAGPISYTTTFEQGTDGWSVSGRNDIGPNSGNPGAALDVEVIDVFAADIRNDENNPNFIGDYTTLGSFRLSVDIKIDSITFGGLQVARDIIVELRDTTTPNPKGYPYTSVWYNLGTLSASQPGWRTFSVEVVDPFSSTLPLGWAGYGDEDAFGNPKLPDDRTFTSVLKQVDELHFTTAVPGYFYGPTNFFMKVDNISVQAQDSCPADCDLDGVLTIDDFVCFQTYFAIQSPSADCDLDGSLTIDDFVCFQTLFAIGC
jgi:hypothetical protein